MVEVDNDWVRLAAPPPQGDGTLRQDIVATTAQELGLAFEEFWGGVWNRDSVLSLQYAAMRPLLASMPQVAQLPPITVGHWRHAIRKMSPRGIRQLWLVCVRG